MGGCAVFGVYAVVVLRVLFLFVHNSTVVCGPSSLRILHTQTDCDILEHIKGLAPII